MAVTRSWTMAGTAPVMVRVERHRASVRFVWLIAASLLVATGLWSVYQAKVQRMAGSPVLNVNAVASPEELLPVLEFFPDRADLAPRVYDYLERARPLRNTGALTAVIPRRQFGRVKPLIAVRTAAEFRTQLLRSALLYFAGFWIVALIWRLTKFRGDSAFLPALQLLTGFGFLLMVGMRDPLRDSLEFQKFAIGVFLGSLLLALSAFQIFDYRRLSRWCYTPLFAALGLFGLLMAFGRGPAGNDAKVNLGIVPTRRTDQDPAGDVSRGLFRAPVGAPARSARNPHPGPTRRARRTMCFPWPLPLESRSSLFFVLKDLGPALVTLLRISGDVHRGARPSGLLAARHRPDGGGALPAATAPERRTPSCSASTCGSRPGITTSTAATN